MSIYLIRHGETALNAARVLQPPDTPLSALGLRQAEALAERLATLDLAAIVSSDLPRAWQTAAAIAATTGLPVLPNPLLHERNFGELRGLPYDTLDFDALTMAAAPPGGESIAEFTRRVTQAFTAVVELRATLSGPLAVVTHGLVIRTLLDTQLALPEATTPLPAIANTSVTIIAALPPHTVTLLDCTAHLDAAWRQRPAGLSGG